MDDSKKLYLENAFEDLLRAIRPEIQEPTLHKKLKAIADLLKAEAPKPPNIKLPKLAGPAVKVPAVPKVPGMPNPSKKDPVKVAQQIQEAGTKKIEVKSAKVKKKTFKVTNRTNPLQAGKAPISTTASMTVPMLKSADLDWGSSSMNSGTPAVPEPTPLSATKTYQNPVKKLNVLPAKGKITIKPVAEMAPLVAAHKIKAEAEAKAKGQTPEAHLSPPTPQSLYDDPKLVDAKAHAIHPRFNGPEQEAMINGLDLNERHEDPAQRGVTTGTRILPHKDGHKLVVKNSDFGSDYERFARGHQDQNFGSAKREVTYHNLANDFFGMGKYVPTTASFKDDGKEMSAMKVADASHAAHHLVPHANEDGHAVISDHYHKTLKGMHDSGDLHKLALMNSIMGNHDRHTSNFMIDNKKPQLHMIDNGGAFDYINKDKNVVPGYIRHAHTAGIHQDGPLNAEAGKWLQNLDPEKAKALFKEHGMEGNHAAAEGFDTKLKTLQKLHADNPDEPLENLLLRAREASGPEFDEKDAVSRYARKAW